MKTKIGLGAGALGLVILIFGLIQVISGLMHGSVSASAKAGDSTYVMTEAGVLDLMNDDVHIEVVAPDKKSPVHLALGVADDVTAWAEGLPVSHVTGLSSWDKLATKNFEAQVEERPAVLGSDMWLEEKSGTGKIVFDYTVKQSGGIALIAQTEGENATAPTLTLTWQKANKTGLGIPLTVIGILLLIIGFLFALIDSTDGKDVESWNSSLPILGRVIAFVKERAAKKDDENDDDDEKGKDEDNSVPTFSSFTSKESKDTGSEVDEANSTASTEGKVK